MVLIEGNATSGALGERLLLGWLMQPHAGRIPVTLEDILRRPEWDRHAAGRGWRAFHLEMDANVLVPVELPSPISTS